MGRKKDNGSDIAAYIILFVIAAPIFLIWILIKLIVIIYEWVRKLIYENQLGDGNKIIDNDESSIMNNKLQINQIDIWILDLITKMIMGTEKKFEILSQRGILIKIDLNKMLLEFLKDSEFVDNINELKKMYTKEYYIKKAKKYFKNNIYPLEKIAIEAGEAPPREVMNHVVGNIDNDDISEKLKYVYEKVDYVNVKQTKQIDDDEQFYILAFDYLIDSLTTASWFAMLLFIDKIANEIKEDNEFFVILKNMSKEISDAQVIAEKTKPLFEEFYETEFGKIEDENLYRIFVELLISKINEIEKPLEETEERLNSFQELDEFIEKWIINLAKENKNANIYCAILMKIKNKININDYNLFITALKQTPKYMKLYNQNVKQNKNIDMRERYLNGDFSKEKEEINEKYNFNNIKTGTQFEIYLTDVFKKLGYKTVHNGKAGDQGADLILKKDNYTYAVQAKFYTDKLSNTPVQEIVGALKYYNANQGVVVTNSTFTKGAEDLAKANNVILIDGEKLNKLVEYIFEENNEDDVLQKFIN